MALDYNITFGGLTIGTGTSFLIQNSTGLEDLPDLRSGDTARAYMHGEVPGLDLASGRRIVIDLIVVGGSAFHTNVELLKNAAMVASSESTLTFQLPSRLERSLRARCRRRSIPVSMAYGYRSGNASLEFRATDPRIYDLAFTTQAIALPSAATGLTFNAPAPFVFGSAGTGGVITVTNSGNFPAPWVATVIGPVTNPVLTCNGQAVTFNGTVNAGETLVIDSLGRSVLLNGTASRYSWVAATSAWFELPVGSSSVNFGATSGTGTCNFSYRSTWL